MPPRLPTLLLLALFAAYQGVCFVETWRDTRGLPKLLPDDLSWPAGWRMFTVLDKTNTRLDFEGWDGEAWVRLPMERWFPARWESGPRWARSGRDPRALQAFAAAACTRVEVDKIRVIEVRWERTPGVVLQPERRRRETERATWTCGRAVRPAAGREL